MAVALGRFGRVLTGAGRVGVDTSVLIYHLEDVSPYAGLTTSLLTLAAAGRIQLIISTVSVAEILVGPLQKGLRAEANQINSGMRAIPGLQTADVTRSVAVEAAEIRASTSLPLPDALIIASVAGAGARLLVTNDAAWRRRDFPCRIAILDDYV